MTIDLQKHLKDSGILEILEELDNDFIGLDVVKQRIKEIASYLLVQKVRNDLEISTDRPGLHMSFTGNPGTGKTTVAMRMASLLNRLGYIESDHLVAVTRDDLVGQYIGHTAPKTKEVVKRAMGGVLFIDEAYYLYKPENEKDYGQETIEIILQMMESNRTNLIVIFAGYKNLMDKFFTGNPGLQSRISHHLHFPDYKDDELFDIAQMMIAERSYTSNKETNKAIRQYIQKRKQQPHFANARSMRNAVERATLRQAGRLMESTKNVSVKELQGLEPDDILLSAVFNRN